MRASRTVIGKDPWFLLPLCLVMSLPLCSSSVFTSFISSPPSDQLSVNLCGKLMNNHISLGIR